MKKGMQEELVVAQTFQCDLQSFLLLIHTGLLKINNCYLPLYYHKINTGFVAAQVIHSGELHARDHRLPEATGCTVPKGQSHQAIQTLQRLHHKSG